MVLDCIDSWSLPPSLLSSEPSMLAVQIVNVLVTLHNQGLSIQKVNNLYHMFKNCCRPTIPSIIADSWFTSGQ